MPKNEGNAYQRAIELQNSGQSIPAMTLVRDNPKAAALISKLTVDKRVGQQHTANGNRDMSQINAAEMRTMAQFTAQDIADAETVSQILSDTELAAQILVSVILSPKDMMTIDPTYTSPAGKWPVPHDVNSALINSARDHFEQVYKIKALLPTMLHDILFRRGSYPIAVVPENAIDEIIHGKGEIKMESLASTIRSDGSMHPMGILGPLDKEHQPGKLQYKQGVGLSLEHVFTHTPSKNWDGKVMMFKDDQRKELIDPLISVTDNVNLLKIPQINQRVRESKISSIIGRPRSLSLESIYNRSANIAGKGGSSDAAITSAVYRSPQIKFTNVAIVKNQERLARRAIGGPLVMHLPSEAVIPVHVPNRPDHHIGFFVLIDGEGNPINRAEGIDHYRELGQRFAMNSSFSSAMLERSRGALNDNSAAFGQHRTINTATRLYAQMLEDDLLQRLRNGLVGSNAAIATDEEVYRLMLSRSLANQQTQLLYIPAEYMTYMAFQYKSNGIGKSLLDNSKIINSMRAMLLVGNVMAALRNSIGRTHVNLKLDPESPDPMKSIEMAMGEIMRVNNHGFPLGSTNPLDITESLQRSMFEFSITGHPGMPDMEIDFQQKNDSYAKPDTDLEEALRKRALMSYYLTPEQVDAATGSDFATSVANNSTLLSKRALNLQQQFTPMVSDHMRKYMTNTADLIDDYIHIVEENYEKILESIDESEIEMSDGSRVTKAELKDDPMLRAVLIKEVVEDFLANFTVSLPEPDITKTDIQADAYDKHEALVEKALKAWISEDLLNEDMIGDAAGHIRAVFEQVKAYFMRDYQIRNGVLPELSKLTSKGEDGEVELDLIKIQADHAKDITSLITGLFSLVKKTKDKADKELKKAGISDDTANNSFGSDSGGDGGGSGGDDFGFDAGGGFSMDDGLGGDGSGDGTETPNDETTPAEEPAAGADQNNDQPDEDKEKKDDAAGDTSTTTL